MRMFESLGKARCLMRSLASPETMSTIGHWNVRTMYWGAEQIAKEMDGYHLDVYLCLSGESIINIVKIPLVVFPRRV
jgi:hypothetical protein